MKRAVVLGANGFVGTWVVKELINNNVFVYAVVRDKNSDLEKLHNLKNVEIIYCSLENILNLDQYIKVKDIDVLYNFAWNGSAGSKRMDAKLQLDNVLWTINSVQAARNLGCKRFVGAGSIMEKESIMANYTQQNAPGMAYIYGDAKVAAHCMSKSVAASLGIDHVWGLITNAYGEGEYSPRFVNTTIRKIIDREVLNFTSGIQNYDFVYISDVAKAFYLLGLYGRNNCEYVIGSSYAKPLKEFIIEIQQKLAPDQELNFGNVPFTGINLSIEEFDTTMTETDTGFKASVSFGDGIKKTMEWIKTIE